MSGAFKLVLKAENTGTGTLPFGLGWHPYFKVGNDALNGMNLIIPETDHLILGDRNLPTGEAKDFDHTTLKLRNWALDDCFRLKKEGMECSLTSEVINLKMQGSPEVQVFTNFHPRRIGYGSDRTYDIRCECI